MTRRTAKIAALAVLAVACGKQRPAIRLPAPRSAASAARTAGLLAGFGRADITPPPGVAPGGNGFEAHQSNGYHHRLYARAMVLQGTNGERIAYLAADLPHVSPILHRLTAARIAAATGIGADRLIVAATHTHSAPANFYEAALYNQQSSPVPGYDRAMVAFVVSGLAEAVLAAHRDLAPARAGWASITVPDVTQNRSFGAFQLNTRFASAPPVPTTAQNAVANTWTLLRVDRCDDRWLHCAPRGAFSVFPLHGTGIPPASRLLDGDIHAIVERGLERYIESLNPALGSSDPEDCVRVDALGEPVRGGDRGCAFRSRAIHVFANGTEGDVAPRHLPGSRCGEELPGNQSLEARVRLRRAHRAEGPRTPAALEEWTLGPGASYDDCLSIARRSVNRLGDQLTRYARTLFDAADAVMTSAVAIGRAFTTVDLRSPAVAAVLCEPLTGTANYAGADDIRTRLNRWHILWMAAGTEEGGSAIDRDNQGCDGPKRPGIGPFQKLLVRGYGLPRFAQFSVVRIGDGLVAAAPWEITTEAGARMIEGMRGVVAPGGGIRHATIVGLANGYFQYLVTAEEYAAQEYEGGSTLYGPNTAAVVERALVRLTRSLVAGRPRVRVLPIDAVPGPERSFFPPRTRGPRPSAIRREVISVSCGFVELPPDPAGGARVRALRFVGRWRDAYPGLLVPADGQVIEIQRREANGAFTPVAWDDGDRSAGDDRRLEIRALRPDGAYAWEVRWISDRLVSGNAYRLVLAERAVPGTGVAFPRVPAPGNPLSSRVSATTCP